MIAFKKFGTYGRLGNHLFQYAFLRTTAQRLGVSFYCPNWIGDEVFLLNDCSERAPNPVDVDKTYVEPGRCTGFNPGALLIEDGTDIQGFFQTEKYWDRDVVRGWYTFRDDKISRVCGQYKDIDFNNSVAMSLRFGDYISFTRNRIIFYIPPLDYYMRALYRTRDSENIIVFSDEIEVARQYLRSLDRHFIFIDNTEAYESLYLMTQCRDVIIPASTFGWWGAFLNQHPDKKVVAPAEGLFRPGPFRPLFGVKNNDYLCSDWITLRSLRPCVDNRLCVLIREFFKHPCKILLSVYQLILWKTIWKNRSNA